MNVSDGFGHLGENLKLDPDETSDARELHNSVTDLLIAAGIASEGRLQGSFGRGTMLPPLHDVDKVIELAATLRDELCKPGGPARAFAMIRRVIAEHYPGTTFETKKHALGFKIPGYSFAFDAVPAFNDAGTENGWIDIANTEATGTDDLWVPSNTYVLIKAVADRNKACSGTFIHVVRMAKQVFAEHDIDLPGLHIESFCYQAITSATPYPQAVAAALNKANELLPGSYTEPTGVDDISVKIPYLQRLEARDQLRKWGNKANEALRVATGGDENAACHLWHEIFGDNFPKPPKDDAKTAIGKLATGGMATSAGIITSTSPARPANPSRSWRP